MFGKMKGMRVKVSVDQAYSFLQVRDNSVRGPEPDINALASMDAKSAAVMVWNYHDDDLPAPASPVTITITGLPAKQVTFTHYRIDQEHSNSYEVWKKMGSPQQPTAAQIKELEKAGQLHTLTAPKSVTTTQGQTQITMQLPRQGVSLLEYTWK